MKIFSLGIDYNTSKPLLSPIEENEYIKRSVNFGPSSNNSWILKIFNRNKRGKQESQQEIDQNDPSEAGWTYIYNPNDPIYREIRNDISLFAQHRKSTFPPWPFNNEDKHLWIDWIQRNCSKLKKGPQYLLVLGGVDYIPFGLQSMLNSIACVGRISFDSAEEYRIYFKKIISTENQADGVVKRETFFFATDHGPSDATHFCRNSLVEPLIDYIETNLKAKTYGLIGENAIKKTFFNESNKNPAIAFILSHGIADPKEENGVNGAIFCPEELGVFPTKEAIITSSDININKPCFPGSVFFQFSCFGFGMPAKDDTPQWTNLPINYPQKGFISRLPKELLAHPLGPIAYIGHVDAALLNGFVKPMTQEEIIRHQEYISSYQRAITCLLNAWPVGRALQPFSEEKALYGENILREKKVAGDLMKFISVRPSADRNRNKQEWIKWNNTRNFMLFGDPAVKLSIWKEN